MASAMDSGVDTGNDSNDSSVQEKLSKMDLEFTLQSRSSDSGKETSTSEEEQDERNQRPSTSENTMGGDSLPSISVTRLQPCTLMSSFECHPPPPVRGFQLRPCMISKFDLTPSRDFRVREVFVAGGPYGTEYKGCELVPKMYHRHQRRCSILRLRRCLKNASGPGGPADYLCTIESRRMFRAVCHNNTEALREILASGVNPNCHDSYKRTPLHVAACMGYTNMVKLLLEHGADPNAKDSIGNTPLHLAACTNHVSVITLLLKAGTRVTERDLQGHSPLQLAITKFNIMKRSIMPHPELKEQVCQVISMLTEYMRHKDGSILDTDLLNKFESMVRVSDSSEEVESNIRDLLSNLSTLSLSGSS